MPSPDLAFAASLQDQQRLPQGLALGDALDEVIRCIPFMTLPGGGESIVVARVIGAGNITGLSGWRAPGATPTKGTPTDTNFQFTFRRLDSLSEDDITVAEANAIPNSFEQADQDARRAAVVRKLAVALVAGTGDDINGFLGWENMTVLNRTDVAPSGAITAGGVLETLLRLDDACASGILGNRASAFVTTALGRRNIERSAQVSGFS